jgi:ATP-dependent DNA helicase RecG
VETVDVDAGHTVIVLRVPGGGGPYTYDGRPYLRSGPTTAQMPQRAYERRLLERMHASHRWENQPAEGVVLADLDHTEITITIDEAIRQRRLEEPGTRKAEDLLVGLGLVRDGRLLNAAVVLFGRPERTASNYPQCLLKMARFRGLDKNEFLDNRQENGHAFDLFVRAQRFCRDHLPVAGRFVPGVFERIDDPLYPPAALREALANALCHRDYSLPGGSVSLAIYDDRLEVSSAGPLPFDLAPEDLARPHRSDPWNPLIARTFYRRGLIETWGRGTLKIAEELSAAGLPPPEYEATRSEVIVRFRRPDYRPPTRVVSELSELQQRLVAILTEIGPASLPKVMERLPEGTSSRTVQDNLKLLLNLKQVNRIGKGRWTQWTVHNAVP